MSLTENQLTLKAAQLEEELVEAKAAWVADGRPTKGKTYAAKVKAAEALRAFRQEWREVRDAFKEATAGEARPKAIRAKASVK